MSQTTGEEALLMFSGGNKGKKSFQVSQENKASAKPGKGMGGVDMEERTAELLLWERLYRERELERDWLKDKGAIQINQESIIALKEKMHRGKVYRKHCEGKKNIFQFALILSISSTYFFVKASQMWAAEAEHRQCSKTIAHI